MHLSKEEVYKMPVVEIVRMRLSGEPFKYLVSHAIPNWKNIAYATLEKDFTIEKLLKTDFALNEKRSVYAFQHNKVAFYKLQKKLLGFGFTEADGDFMKFSFSFEKKSDYVQKLIKTKNFSKEDAVLAVELGIRAGWINAN